jgi:AraC family transcriptional regulator
MFEVDVVEEPARRVFGLAHRGPYTRIGETFARLAADLEAAGIRPEVVEWLGVFFDDPCEVPEETRRCFAGVTAREGLGLPRGLEETRLPGGRYARMHVRGPYDGLPDAYDWIHERWLPETGERLGDGPGFEIYVNDPREVAEESILTDVYVPLA